VGYWATDEQKLYVCTPNDHWNFYYEPYIYPHPLTLVATLAKNGHVIETGDGHVRVKMPKGQRRKK
jgi:hypothetical protein